MSSIEISIIIATKNRPAILLVSFTKALAASKGMPVEIIIVNDGDPFSLDLEKGSTIKLFNNPSRGVTTARNYGAKQSKGHTLFFVDDDMCINREALEWILANFSPSSDRRTVYNLNWEYPPELNENLANSKIGRYILSSNYNSMWGRMHVVGEQPLKGLYKFSTIASCSLVLDKSLFDTIGGYNEKLIFQGEDIDLSYKINQLKIPIFCVFDVTLYHNHSDRLNLVGFLERESSGYKSQFKAERMGLISLSSNSYYELKKFIPLELLRINEPALLYLYKIIPNKPSFIKIANKVIGYLASLQRFKQWKHFFHFKRRNITSASYVNQPD